MVQRTLTQILECYLAAPSEDLMKWYANARETFYGASGSHKIMQNADLMKQYGAELANRGIIPDKIAKGSFNGEGSY